MDSYGKCLNNKALPEYLEDTITATGEDPRFMSFVSRYKFHLAFENGLCPDYMTEKLWRPMHQGCVPIYRGSSSVSDWLPNDRAAVLVQDFMSPRELAQYIKDLDENDAEYSRYLEYKTASKVTNLRLLEGLRDREWGVNDMSKPNYLNGFECYVCDRENERLTAAKMHKRDPEKNQAPHPKMADNTHMGCPLPSPGYGTVEEMEPNDGYVWLLIQCFFLRLELVCKLNV